MVEWSSTLDGLVHWQSNQGWRERSGGLVSLRIAKQGSCRALEQCSSSIACRNLRASKAKSLTTCLCVCVSQDKQKTSKVVVVVVVVGACSLFIRPSRAPYYA